MMKTRLMIFAGIAGLVLAALTFLSCNDVIGLGSKLDVQGPVVNFTEPEARMVVTNNFVLAGTVSDRSGVDRMVIKAKFTDPGSFAEKESPKQWRYSSAGWQVSTDSGSTWAPLPPADKTVKINGENVTKTFPYWDGSAKFAEWGIVVDMTDGGPADGECVFTVQAWDVGGMSDDHSFKTRVLIFDNDPPSVAILTPTNVYRFDDLLDIDGNPTEFATYHSWADNEIDSDTGRPAWQSPTMLGKFITSAFDLKWQIDDNADVYSIELRFYKYQYKDDIDENPATDDLPADYIYSTSSIKTGKPGDNYSPGDAIAPNGEVRVPNLAGIDGQGGAFPDPNNLYDGFLENPISGKETVIIVANCFDAAGNRNQERILGYFIFWEAANLPWITYSEGLYKPTEPTPTTAQVAADVAKAYMVYPGRTLKAIAFHSMGVVRVEYSIYTYDTKYDKDAAGASDSPVSETAVQLVINKDTGDRTDRPVVENTPNSRGVYSRIFSWEFEPPSSSGYYVIRAQAFSEDETSEEYSVLFEVKDISFPDFPTPVQPPASDPLFMHMMGASSNEITISGTVSDATEITSLTMVWINPESKGYATMSQLAYFRDPTYAGWKSAENLTPGGPAGTEDIYDSGKPNKLWKFLLPVPDDDPDTYRKVYEYTKTLNVYTDLNIGADAQALKSQMFLLRAENPSGKCTIITYAPQGDEIYPTIKLNKVTVTTGTNVRELTPGRFAQVPKVAAGTTILVEGSWTENSAEKLAVQTYLYPNLKLSISGKDIPCDASGVPLTGLGVTRGVAPATGTVTPSTSTDDTLNVPRGTFTYTITVGASGSANVVTVDDLRDVLMVNATIRDIGWNPAEAGASWLIESDNLKFLRISSEMPDGTYKAGDEIKIFMEFNKPVQLKPGVAFPKLILNGNTAMVAEYDDSSIMENTRQYFRYTVVGGHNTDRLNVTGISPNDTGWNSTTNPYPFSFVNTATDPNSHEVTTEEIRMTMQTGHAAGNLVTIGTPPAQQSFYARLVPTDITNDNLTANPDYYLTLGMGKQIAIDTTAPTVDSITATPAGRHRTGNIYINVKFTEPVKFGKDSGGADIIPYLTFTSGISGTGAAAQAIAERVSGDTITFKYTVKTGDDTGANVLQVASYGPDNSITDIPGTKLAYVSATDNGIASLSGAVRNLASVYVDTVVPAAPAIQMRGRQLSGGTMANITGTVPAILYHDGLEVQFTQSGTGLENRGRIEYTLNNGASWNILNLGNTASETVAIASNGNYTIRARQYDSAGNVSADTGNTAFTWDKGPLITRIATTVSNGTYTNSLPGGRQDTIPIRIYFRKPVTVNAQTTITLNARTVANPTAASARRTVNGPASGTIAAADGMLFSYAVQANDNTLAGEFLDVYALTNLSLNDGTTPIPAAFLTLPAVTNLGGKEIVISTGALEPTSTTPTFTSDTTQPTDGSWTGTMTYTFNRPITKRDGTANVVVSQTFSTANNNANNYRLPAVITEAQWGKYRNIAGINDYYKKGTNGFNYVSAANQGPDTQTKYILNFTEATVVNNTVSSTAIQTLAAAFRAAETVTLPVSSQDIEVSGNTLTVRITAANALQVLGAQYNWVIAQNLVQDSLGYSWPAAATTAQNTVPGVAKAFVRVDKKQESIARVTTINNTTARFTPTFPVQTNARIDCRTPGANVRYQTNNSTHTAAVTNAQGTADDNWWNTNNNASTLEYLARPTTAASATAGTVYSTFTGNTVGANGIGPYIQVGDATRTNAYQWGIRAVGYVGNTASAEAEEMAFRTVLTWHIATELNAEDGNRDQVLANGDQVWIRGGDAIGSSTVAGFPLTWIDDWQKLRDDGTRAGIRLMQKETAGDNLNLATWRWITWEVNVKTYIDFIIGCDTLTIGGTEHGATADEVWQYGPKRWAYQRAGWTAFKENYPLYPGKHRWVTLTDRSYFQAGRMNFSRVSSLRPDDITDTVTAPQP